MIRLRISHTFTTHSFLLKGEDALICVPYQEPYTVSHIETSCVNLEQTRVQHYKENKLQTILNNVNPDNLFWFLKETMLYQKI